MQNQKFQPLMSNNQEQAAGPVEIDAQLLHHVGGGAPKNTWGEESSAAAASTQDNDEPAPKNTW